MKVEIVSEGSFLPALCREIAREFPIKWTIEQRADSSQSADMGLCLWDYGAGLIVPENARWGSTCFVFVALDDLESFRAAHPYAETAIFLKPPTRAVVRALMVQAVATGAATELSQSDDSLIRSDRDNVLQCLMEANLKLQQHDLERTNFLARALHDFHAPLSALGGYCGLLADEQIGLLNERQKLVIDRMHHSVRRLSRMSRAMFQLSVSRRVSLKLSLHQGNIQDCTDQALYEVHQLAAEKKLQLDVDLELPYVPLLIDSGQIEQVMVNLLENACKFSPRSGSIVVRGYSCFFDRRATNVFSLVTHDRRITNTGIPNVYRVDIKDSGPGFAPEHVKSIFEEYVSYSGVQNRSRGGLGLAICSMILKEHQGCIWAVNGRSGAVFSFVLPLNCLESAHQPAAIKYDTTPIDLSTPRV
jgi:signal transduction histidine kinase